MAESMMERVAAAMQTAYPQRGYPDFTVLARAAIKAMRAEIAKYDEQITFESKDGRYFSVEDMVAEEGRQTALNDILAMIDAALASDSTDTA